ncbi:ATP-binding cassette sub-family A member 13-like isoform X2 [Diachasmimorpha longicaudata]|uniref:ATP-binding cassette sub-family A member 13-like isoform X2 n=1 Tax=Diachasmimorpha longicaudata TaxID=58733 RepID=UPI0030B88001
MGADQLGLLLWKNYVVRKRRPAILGLVFLWPIVIFMLLYVVRDNVEPEYNPTCQFPARLMPRDGLLPFVQSYICSVGNPCDPLDNYEEVPSYRNARLGPLMMEFQSLLPNETILSAVKSLPHSVKFLRSMAEILTKPEIKQLFDRGLRLGDLFTNHQVLKSTLIKELPGVREDFIDDLFDTSIKLYYLMESFGSSNIDGVVCTPSSLREFLIVPREENLIEISSALCHLDAAQVPLILQKLTDHLDFAGLLEIVSRVMAKFHDYDFITDITRSITTVLNLETVIKHVPEYLKLREWIPNVLALFRDTNFRRIDLSFINRTIDTLEPIFASDRNWPVVRSGLSKLNSLLEIIQEVVERKAPTHEQSSPFELSQGTGESVKVFPHQLLNLEDVTKILDGTYRVLQDGVKLTKRLLDHHAEDISLSAEAFDGLGNIFSDKIMNMMTYLNSMMENIVRMVHHVAIIHEELQERLFRISKSHETLVNTILAELSPELFRNVVAGFSHLQQTEKFIESTAKAPPADVICTETTFNDIFKPNGSVTSRDYELICSDEGKKIITEVYDAFEFQTFQTIIEKMLQTFVMMAFNRPIPIETSNTTSTVNSVKLLMNFLEHPPLKRIDWSDFRLSDNWRRIFQETLAEGRKDVLAYHLSIAKMVGQRSISYARIKPDLENMDIIADVILDDLRENPTSWINEVREHESELLESFYLTVADRNKTLDILEYSNFSRAYCVPPAAPQLINYPVRGNASLLKGLVCRLARAAEKELEINITAVELRQMTFRDRKSFNWTLFNGKIVEIYGYVDSLVQFDDESDYYFRNLDKLKRNFVDAWTTDLTPEHGVEIVVGVVCRLLDLAESPLFRIQERSAWKSLRALAWSISTIADKIEKILDDVLGTGDPGKPANVLHDMPETDLLLETALRNLPSISLDLIDIFSQKNPIHILKTISDHVANEPNWPCTDDQSLGEALALRPGSQQLLRQVEKIACNPVVFIREWSEHPTFMRTSKIFEPDGPGDVPAFNWTAGYIRFRGLVNKFFPEVKGITGGETFSMDIPNIQEKAKTFLDFIDLEIDKIIPTFRSNITAGEVWMSTGKSRGIDDILVIAKFSSKVLHDLVHLGLEILEKPVETNAKSLNLLTLLGFTSKSVVSIVRQRFPYILATVVYGISDPELDHQLHRAVENAQGITCEKMFSLFEDYKVGLTNDEYLNLKNFTCDHDTFHFNAFFDLYLDATAYWRRPVSHYRSYFFTLAHDIHDFAVITEAAVDRKMVIDPPLDKQYLNDAVNTLKNILQVPRVLTSKLQTKQPESGWTIYRLFVEGLSEGLKNAAFALRENKLEDNVMHLWDMVRPGDVHQLIKFLEARPTETLSLAATLVTLNASDNSLIAFNDVRGSMCHLRFDLNFWRERNNSEFLDHLCTYDPRQLVRSATSEEYLNVITGRSSSLDKIDPLSKSLLKFIETVWRADVNSSGKLAFQSNILNFTTWRDLSNDSKRLIHDADQSWVHKIMVEVIPLEYNFSVQTFSEIDLTRIHNIFQDHPLNAARQIMQLADSWMDVISGGDIWQKLRMTYENTKMKSLLSLIEDAPNLVITVLETFISSERLTDFMDKFIGGQVNLCDIERYLIPPSYVRKKGILTSVTSFCQKFILSNANSSTNDFKPLGIVNVTLRGNILDDINIKTSDGNTWIRVTLNETYFMDTLVHFQSTLLRSVCEGNKPPKVPSWWISFREGTLIDFKKQFQERDLRSLSHTVVSKSVKIVKNILSSSAEFKKSCSFCDTRVVEILNSQLSRHRVYSDILCKYKRMKVAELQEMIGQQLYLKKTIGMIKNYDFMTKKFDVESFMGAIEDSLQYLTDIIMDYKDPGGDGKLESCLMSAVEGVKTLSPAIYMKVLAGALDGVRGNVNIIQTIDNHETLLHCTQMAEKFIPIWKPLKDVAKNSSTREVEKVLPNASLNVNLLFGERNNSLCKPQSSCVNATTFNDFLNSRGARKLLNYDPKAAGYPSTRDISELLVNSLDFELINRELPSWRTNGTRSLTWVKQILDDLMRALEESGNLLEVASKIDFQDVSNVLGVPDIADGVVYLVKDQTIDKLFAALKDIVEDVEPFIESPQVIKDLNSIVDAFESMEIFKNLGLLDMKYSVNKMFHDWSSLRKFLIDEIKFPNDLVDILSETKVDMLSVFMKERSAMSLTDTVCSTDQLKEILDFEASRTSADEVSRVLCSLGPSVTQNLAISLIKNTNFDYVFKNLMSANVKNILKNANLSEAEGNVIFDNLGVVGELLPLFKDKMSSDLSAEPSGAGDTEDSQLTSGKFLQDASELMCGRQLISDSGEFYRLITQIEDTKKTIDQRELDSLPTEFCRDTYKSFLSMTGGKIVWSYVKPLLRGKILYAPDSPAVRKVMSLANHTFHEMEIFGEFMSSIEATLIAVADLTDMGSSLGDLKEIMASKVMKIAVQSMSGGRVQGDLSNFDLGELAWRLKKSNKLIAMIGMLNNLVDCILIDRVIGFSSEEELEVEARKLTDTNEFLAGVVFLDNEKLSRRSLGGESLEHDVTYKIRMDVDYVPSTKRLKNQFWVPGPEGSFIEDLRYLRGFVQLQDSIDRAIIEVKSGKELNWKTVSQQMPYPCWKYAPFQRTLYESQGLITCFFFAMMMCVGSAVRYIVWERESQNSMVMSVMGLKPWRNTLAWFITTTIELTIVVTSICIILVAGKILPHSDPGIIMILFLDYVFAIVTFCYMISTMFRSASLAAVTTVVMFLLTYMPYVIVIAMEATMGLAYNLILCLSMSTSFCYGCLYTVRREVQGTGMQWKHLWEEPSPGDPMSLGLVLTMLALDGCLYAAIGYVIVRYTNSDEDNDATTMAVSEKQVGVRFEGVRKIYDTEQGEVIAVDDFTLKLCKGEVTGLLGRNGAGKTTIIKMLTGMIAPTSGEIHLDGDEGSKPDIGVCPQDNVLIDTLTPREHMIFYAKLKRPLSDEEMLEDVNSMLSSLELGRQEHEPVSRLSGGTKRRLCVALAFLGSPKLVILDEPGAGVDPAARRRIWKLIDHHRQNRTVLLSTHHLDEADMLSDTVVIMHKGKVLCKGSPLTLKTTYGQGYWLNVSFPTPEGNRYVERQRLQKLVESIVPNATLDSLSSEVRVSLPFQGKHGVANDIAGVIKKLEDSKTSLGFSRISLDCDTLERVFLSLCGKAEHKNSHVGGSLASVNSGGSVSLNIFDDTESIIGETALKPSPWRQIRALLMKRMWHFARDWRAPLATLLLPTIFVAIAMGFSLIRPPSSDEPPLDLNPKLYDTHVNYFYSIDNSSDLFLQRVSSQLHDKFGGDYAGAWQIQPNDTGTCDCLEGQQVCHGVSKAVEGLFQTLPGRPTLDWIVSTFHEYIEKRYGGWSLSHWHEDPLFVVWFNNKGHHSLPAYLNSLNGAILRASGVPGRITTFNHPLKLSSDQLNRTSVLQHVADVGIALVLLIAFSLVAAQGARELVRERLSEEKRILYLAGVHPVTYWTAAFLWDFLVFLSSIGLAVIVFEIFGLSAYVARDNLQGIVLLLVLFAWASIPFSHFMEKSFDDASLSNMVLFCLNTFVGVICLATIMVIDIVGKSQAAKDTRQVLHNLMLFFPQYALGDALVQMSTNDITAELLERFNMDTYKSPLGWSLIGQHYVYLFVVGVVFYLVNIVIECRLLLLRKKEAPVDKISDEDEDVSMERTRVENSSDRDIIKTVRLRKVYNSVYGKNIAVKNLSFGVQAGTCFGLLGINGAGKSTTFKMLTTEITPTSGKIILKGRQVAFKPLCNGEIGYCSQTDSLDGFLTPHQCLTIHGQVCGLADVTRSVVSTLRRFDLSKYSHQRISSLSGGNKRKLCAAISVMSPVSVVLMDEPTSGMDPASKELVARAVHQVTQTEACVIMTSHSVAECEKLCSRVGILASAGLRCIGSPQHLKHKYGEGYVAFLRFPRSIVVSEVKDVIYRYFPTAQVFAKQARAARLLIPQNHELLLSEIFTKLKCLACDLKATDYTLTQSSLDQVLVNFSTGSEDDCSDLRSNSRRRINLNSQHSVDGIHMDTF